MSATDTVPATQFLPANSQPPTPPHGTRSRPLQASSERAYAKDMRQFFEIFKGSVPCDPRTVERYIASLRNRAAPTTIYRRAMALRNEHLRLGHPSPTDAPELRPLLRQLQKGIVPLKKGAAAQVPKRKEPRQAKPVTRGLLAKMLDAMGTNSLDRRDRCLLLLGFAAALSRSALVSLDVSDLAFTNDVMIVSLRETGEQGKAKRSITVPITGGELCAATATRAWIEHAALDIEGGPLLLSFDRAGDPTKHRLHSAWVSCVVKMRLAAVGTNATHFSGLSLRRGRLMEIAKGVM